MSILTELASAKASLEEAALERDWFFVCDAYKVLFGTELDLSDEPEPEENNTDKVILQMMKRIEQLELKPNSAPKTKTKKPTKGLVKAGEKISWNKFDEMSGLLGEAGKEVGFDKINDKVKPVQRNRQAYKPTSVKCEACQASFEVNALFARENYTCDACLKKRGL